MATQIFKYKLEITDRPEILMPKGAQILSACEQNDGIDVYALVYPDAQGAQGDKREFRIIETGHIILDNMCTYRFLNTVKLQGGALMFHVFVKK